MPARSKTNEGAIYRARLKRVSELAIAQDIDHFLITNPIDVAYFTGFLGGDSYLLVGPLPAGGKPAVISDFRYEEELEPVRAIARIVIRTQSMHEAVVGLLSDTSVKRVGIQGEAMPVAERDALSRRLGRDRIVTTTGLAARLRAIKDEHEVALIKAAIKIQQEALEAILPDLEPGMTELDVAADLEAEMKSRGSREPGFQTLVASGPHASLPHYRPSATKLSASKPVLIDWGATFRGYHGDMTRVFAFGKWPAKIREIYGIVLDAHEKAAAALAPGKHTHEIDLIAREHVAAAGYGEHFRHGLGHGMGLNGHEDPRLNPMAADMILEPGNVVTIEPGIYLPGVGGVRLEDDYLVTAKGARNLCSMPKDLAWATR